MAYKVPTVHLTVDSLTQQQEVLGTTTPRATLYATRNSLFP